MGLSEAKLDDVYCRCHVSEGYLLMKLVDCLPLKLFQLMFELCLGASCEHCSLGLLQHTSMLLEVEVDGLLYVCLLTSKNL